MKVISLFAGCGGMDLGFIRAGHEIVWANDNDPDCVQTYRRNIGRHIVEANIEKIRTNSIPDADIVMGGFPCQGFSTANMRRSFRDERNSLYLEFLRVLKAKQPPYFIAENVPGILNLEKGAVMRMIIKDFENKNYRVKYQLFNVADYGVPQNRRRVIIIGTRKDLPENLEPEFPKPTHSKNNGKSSKLNHWITIKKGLDDIPEPDSCRHKLHNHVYSKYKVTNRDFTGHRSTDPNKPSPTILARGNGKGGVCAIQHPKNHRRLSVRESAIVQTFPNKFVFYGKMNSMYRQVGNAVPVHFAKKLALIFTRIEKNSESKI